MTNPLPNNKLPVLGPDGHFTLPWWRWFQAMVGGSAGATGPQGPAGPAGPTGPTGPSGAANDTLGLVNLSALNSRVRSVTSTTADLTALNPYGDVRLTIVSAPKWDTARTLSFTGDATGSGSVDGSANVATGLTLATVNANTGTWGDATHVGQFTVNGKGLITAVSSIAITYPTFSTPPYSRQVPLTGFTITIGNAVNVLILDPAGTLAAGTVTMPAAPTDAQEVTVASSQIITALTVQANAGQTIDGGLSAVTFAANAFAKWKYAASVTTWYRIG